MYVLIADHDSSYFQLVGEETLTDADLHKEGIHLRTQVAGPGSCSVVWTKVRIRATEIIDLAAEARTQAIAELQQQLTGDLPASALQFDGRTQYVTIPSIRYDGSHPITLEAFATPDRSRAIVIGDTEQSGVDLGIPDENYTMHAWNGMGYASARSVGPASRLSPTSPAPGCDSLGLWVSTASARGSSRRPAMIALCFPKLASRRVMSSPTTTASPSSSCLISRAGP